MIRHAKILAVFTMWLALLVGSAESSSSGESQITAIDIALDPDATMIQHAQADNARPRAYPKKGESVLMEVRKRTSHVAKSFLLWGQPPGPAFCSRGDSAFVRTAPSHVGASADRRVRAARCPRGTTAQLSRRS